MHRFVPIVSLFLCAAHAVFAGPLDPPAGAVSSTMKTLSEVEPRIALSAENTPGDLNSFYKIRNPGSYYLTENTDVQVLAGFALYGIEITASDVTIDLNGFTLRGLEGTQSGVFVNGTNLSGIVITNGAISGFLSDGIDGQTNEAVRCEVRNVRVTAPAGYGINLGENSLVADCTVSDAGLSGVRVREHSRVVDCSVTGNGFKGGVGLGINDGIFTAPNCVVLRCMATGNDEAGIYARDNSQVVACIATSNGTGIRAGVGSLVLECTANENGFSGFNVSSGVVVRSCVAEDNDANGIWARGGSYLVDNLCVSNQSGIRIEDFRGRVEGNHLWMNNVGMAVEGDDHLIISNTCTDNSTNWSIDPGNRVAPIVQANGNGSAITGDVYTGSLGTTDPNANFTY